MRNTLKDFKARALTHQNVRREYEGLKEEFEILDEILKARAEAGLTQAELAARIGTTQSAVARLETAMGKHSPSIGTLKRYASALGYRLQVRLVKNQDLTTVKEMTHSMPVGSNALLAKARAIRRNPKGIRATDRLFNSLKGRPRIFRKRMYERSKRAGEFNGERLFRDFRGCSKFPPARPQGAGRLRRTFAVGRREARDRERSMGKGASLGEEAVLETQGGRVK